MKDIIGILLMASYFVILLRFFPGGKKTFDVFKLNPYLLPFWWKYVGIIFILFISAFTISEHNFAVSNTFLLAGFYFGLLQIVFSKEKKEDEFSIQIRMKAMYISLISMFFMAGIFSSIEIINPGSFKENTFYFFMMLFNATLIVYLVYFYLTKYFYRK